MLANEFPHHPLEARQITNIINQARKNAREDVERLGGDVNAVLTDLRQRNEAGEGWSYHIRLDDSQTLVALWWQSNAQARLGKRYSDILLNDNSYNRNQYGYPLNIGIAIDGFGVSRNIWYSFHATEDLETHAWVYQRHLESTGCEPDVLYTDRHPTLIRAAADVFPLTSHMFCLYHMKSNVVTNLRRTLSSCWDQFLVDFWAIYRAVSPWDFDRQWNDLLAKYPDARDYLEHELYPCRHQWAWAWVSQTFTAGCRTTGRAEVENRMNKAITGPKKTLLGLYHALNERTAHQSEQELVRVRDVCFFLSLSEIH